MIEYKPKKNIKGFTMLEIIIVLILVGIISAVIVSGIKPGNIDLETGTQVIKSRLRYAQTRAMNSNSIWGIYINNNTYTLFNNGSIANTIKFPEETTSIINLPSGITLTDGTISFDSWGKPYTDAAGTTLQANDRTLTVSRGADTKLIIITKNTGFIQ